MCISVKGVTAPKITCLIIALSCSFAFLIIFITSCVWSSCTMSNRDGSSFTWHQSCNSRTALLQLRWILQNARFVVVVVVVYLFVCLFVCLCFFKLQSLIQSRIRLERKHREQRYSCHCEKHSLMPAGFFTYLFMNDSLPRRFVCCCNLMMFYDWSECVMSVLGTTTHS